MPRPVSWLPQSARILRSVASSARSHYDRRDLEHLFGLQARAAQNLLEMVPTHRIGTSLLVERDALIAFLEAVREASDVGKLFTRMRSEKQTASRRKSRALVRRDANSASLDSLPESVSLSRGRMVVTFRTAEQLAEALYFVARLLEDTGAAQEALFETEEPPLSTISNETDVEAMFAELTAFEKRACSL